MHCSPGEWRVTVSWLMAGAGRAFGLPLAILVVVLLVVAPRAASAQPAVVTVGTRVLLLRDGTPTSQRKLSWTVRSRLDDPAHQVATPEPGSATDPTTAGLTGGGAVLTFYNSAGSGESFTVPLLAEGWRLWDGTVRRYVYTGDPAVHPIGKIWLRGTRLTVRGGKQQWGYTLDEASQGRIAIRLTLGTGVTYCTDVPARTTGTPPSTAATDRPDRFVGVDAPAPDSCPPLP